jgi:hypothetical protein
MSDSQADFVGPGAVVQLLEGLVEGGSGVVGFVVQHRFRYRKDERAVGSAAAEVRDCFPLHSSPILVEQLEDGVRCRVS